MDKFTRFFKINQGKNSKNFENFLLFSVSPELCRKETFCRILPTPCFVESPGPGGEGDSFGLQGSGSILEEAGFNRGFSAALRPRHPLRKDTGWNRENPFPPGFFIPSSPRRAIRAGGKLAVGKVLGKVFHQGVPNAFGELSLLFRGDSGGFDGRADDNLHISRVYAPVSLWHNLSRSADRDR